MKKYFSFNVFDTLITRKTGAPEHVFLVTAMQINAELGLTLDPAIFARLRVQAERELLKTGTIPDISEIYDRLAGSLNITGEQARQFMAIELEVENEQSLPVPGGIALVNEAREQGFGIVYISDMYLNASHIEALLRKHDIIQSGEKVFVSCDYRKSKKTGSLFLSVMAELGIAKTHIHHYGNSKSSDIDGAKRVGISHTYLPAGNLNRYEKFLASANARHHIGTEDVLRYSRMAASSRYARLTGSPTNRIIYDTACSVAAPVLYLFVESILNRHPRKTIWFLSRDGYILYRIAQKLKDQQHPDADLRYLHISREVLTLAMLADVDDSELIKSLRKIYSSSTLMQVMTCLDVGDHVQQAPGISRSLLDRDISDIDESQLLSVFMTDGLMENLRQRAEQKRDNLLGYLRQQGLLRVDKSGRWREDPARNGAGNLLVDVGWQLTIHDLLAQLCRQEGVAAPDGCYMGINGANAFVSNGRKEAFLWDLRIGVRGDGANGLAGSAESSPGSLAESTAQSLPGAMPRPWPRVTRIIEAFCSAPHGQTVDYAESDGVYKPVLNDYETKFLLDWGLKDLEAGVLQFTDTMVEFGHRGVDPERECVWDRHVCMELLGKFWMQPERKEIDAWGTYPFFISRDMKKMIPLYRKYPFPKVVFAVLRHGGLPNGQYISWPNAPLFAGNRVQRRMLLGMLKLRGMLSVKLTGLLSALALK